mgnify:CR=1 FL=1
METDERNEELPEQEQPVYTPRPKWQVWAARIGLLLFVAMVIMYYIHMMRGAV